MTHIFTATNFFIINQLIHTVCKIFLSILSARKSLLTLLLTFSDIKIEEVTIEHSLNTASNHCDEVKESFHVVAIDPVEYVQSTINAKSKQIVTCNCLSFARLADHKQLRKNCH